MGAAPGITSETKNQWSWCQGWSAKVFTPKYLIYSIDAFQRAGAASGSKRDPQNQWFQWQKMLNIEWFRGIHNCQKHPYEKIANPSPPASKPRFRIWILALLLHKLKWGSVPVEVEPGFWGDRGHPFPCGRNQPQWEMGSRLGFKSFCNSF